MLHCDSILAPIADHHYLRSYYW